MKNGNTANEKDCRVSQSESSVSTWGFHDGFLQSCLDSVSSGCCHYCGLRADVDRMEAQSFPHSLLTSLVDNSYCTTVCFLCTLYMFYYFMLYLLYTHTHMYSTYIHIYVYNLYIFLCIYICINTHRYMYTYTVHMYIQYISKWCVTTSKQQLDWWFSTGKKLLAGCVYVWRLTCYYSLSLGYYYRLLFIYVDVASGEIPSP